MKSTVLTGLLIVGFVVFVLGCATAPVKPTVSERFKIGNGLVADTQTGVVWQQGTSGNSMIWKEAKAYCDSLDLAGQSDWRLPTKKELRKLRMKEKYNKCRLPKNTFEGPCGWFWSARKTVSKNFRLGGFTTGMENYEGNQLHHDVRCVRLGDPTDQLPLTESEIKQEDESQTDQPAGTTPDEKTPAAPKIETAPAP